MQKLIAIAIAGLLCATIAAAGGLFVLSPLWRARPGSWVAVTAVDSLPDDGEPRLFVVSLPDVDAWTRRPDRPVYTVYLRRLPASNEVVAIYALTRYGVALDYDPEAREFHERCWRFRFDLDGKCLHATPHSGLTRIPVRPEDGVAFVPASPPAVRWGVRSDGSENGRQR